VRNFNVPVDSIFAVIKSIGRAIEAQMLVVCSRADKTDVPLKLHLPIKSAKRSEN